MKDPVIQFVDLLSVSNISLIVFAERCYGYYIHGRSVHAHADTNMAGLLDSLRKEEENMCGTRGLQPNSIIQTFEVYFSLPLREHYDKIYSYVVLQDIIDRQTPNGKYYDSLLI